MASIQLTKGVTALVDEEDHASLSFYKWHTVNGYAVRRGRNGEPRTVHMHRVLAKAFDGIEVDHINGNRADNRKENLRLCTHKQNMRNRKIQKNNKSGYKGVRWHEKDKKWRAEITLNKKSVFIGNFPKKELAAAAYNIVAKSIFKQFSRLNTL